MQAGNRKPLPLHDRWSSSDDYVASLLTFVTETDLLRNLCGGVHILDFLTREPDLYTWVLPPDWRAWFEVVDVHDLLDFLLRENLASFGPEATSTSEDQYQKSHWRGYPFPPQTLVHYVDTVRVHCLQRQFEPVSQDIEPLPRHISVGMKPKKIHEVVNFAAYIDKLSASLSQPGDASISIVDFGSGQNYLGRTLVCPPYDKHVVAIEQRHHNVEGAKGMDVLAKLAKKEKIMRNKKEYKRELALMNANGVTKLPTHPSRAVNDDDGIEASTDSGARTLQVEHVPDTDDAVYPNKGSITYIEHALESGHLEHIIDPHKSSKSATTSSKSLVVSIHSCGNLTHHGLRSIVLNKSIEAVAMIGCCYNLLTERLGPATYKHPQLRPNHPRLEATGSTYDPHGFPMSKRFEDFSYKVNTGTGSTQHEKGVRLNITARMMAVQAPHNWGREDSESFFTRHFYRALLQRILLDRGVVQQALSPDQVEIAGGSLSGRDTQGTPLIIGTLPKAAFTSFPNYVTAALRKLTTSNHDVEEGRMIASKTSDLLSHPGKITEYEEQYGYARKHLAVIWTLMAFSAGVVESAIVVDRWLWLKEQPEVKEAWVEAVFGYDQSPRNLCVVGVKHAGS